VRLDALRVAGFSGLSPARSIPVDDLTRVRLAAKNPRNPETRKAARRGDCGFDSNTTYIRERSIFGGAGWGVGARARRKASASPHRSPHTATCSTARSARYVDSGSSRLTKAYRRGGSSRSTRRLFSGCPALRSRCAARGAAVRSPPAPANAGANHRGVVPRIAHPAVQRVHVQVETACDIRHAAALLEYTSRTGPLGTQA